MELKPLSLCVVSTVCSLLALSLISIQQMSQEGDQGNDIDSTTPLSRIENVNSNHHHNIPTIVGAPCTPFLSSCAALNCNDGDKYPRSISSACDTFYDWSKPLLRQFFVLEKDPLRLDFLFVPPPQQARRNNAHQTPPPTLFKTSCAREFNKSRMQGSAYTDAYAAKFAAEVLIPFGLRQSPYFSRYIGNSVKTPDFVVVELCNVFGAHHAHMIPSIHTYITSLSQYAEAWHVNKSNFVVTLTWDHGPCVLSNEKNNAFQNRTWMDERIRGATLLQNEGSVQGGCYHRGSDFVIPTSVIILDKYTSGAQPSARCTREPVRNNRSGSIFFAGKLDSLIRRNIAEYFNHDTDFYLPASLHHNEYMCAMERSIFCIAARGNAGWSPRLDEAIQLGCIPVIMADNTDFPFSHILNYSKFSVKVPEADYRNLKVLLQNISEDQIRELQSNLLKVKGLFRYSGFEATVEYGADAIPAVAFELWLKKTKRWRPL